MLRYSSHSFSDHEYAWCSRTVQIGGPENVMCLREYITSEGYDLGDHMIYPHTDELALELYNNLTNAARTLGYKVNVYLKEVIICFLCFIKIVMVLSTRFKTFLTGPPFENCLGIPRAYLSSFSLEAGSKPFKARGM